MNIVLATNQLEMGGIEMNIVRLTGALVERGHRVTVCSRPGSLVPDVIERGGSHVPMHMRPSSARRLLDDALTLRTVLRSEGTDVVHVFSAAAAIVLWPAVRLVRPRPATVASIMGIRNTPDEPPARVWLRAFSTTLGARMVIVTAPAIGALVERLPVRRRRLRRGNVVGVEVPAPLDPEARVALRVELGLSEDERVVLTVGRLEPSKSHELFVRGCALVERPAVRFLVAGGGALEPELRETIRALAATSPVTLLGERSDVPSLLSIADVYVRPGIVEGFVGLTVLEAQALGVPVVSFETEDVKLAIEDGVTGVLIPSGDVAALASAITRLIDDPAEARRIGLAGLEHVRSTFSIDNVATELLELYTSVAAQGR